jgi:hypothetical protein
MDDDPKEMITTILPALTKCQQHPAVPKVTAANFLCDDSAIPRSLPRHSPYKLERAGSTS